MSTEIKVDQNKFSPKIRDELGEDYRVFYVTSWGSAADHLYYWFCKALNSHKEIFVLHSHEGARPKYMTERTRAERPPLIPFTEFLNDMGMPYTVIGDCSSYRAGQMPELLSVERYRDIPVVNMPRHPLPWLEFHVRWRASNMRMRVNTSDPLAWEWKVACHAYFDYLGLRKYDREEVDVWAAYQGMLQLNNVLGDIGAVSRHLPVERVADDPEIFKEVVTYLSRGLVEFDQAALDSAYSMRHTLFRGEEPVECDPATLLGGWPDWKVDAFRKLLLPEALDIYKSFGYDMQGLDQGPRIVVKNPQKVPRPIFVSTVMKSGTVLLQDVLEQMTGLALYEPPIGLGAPDYESEKPIEIPPGKFFCWHSTLNSRSVSLLKGCQSKNIFLVRNVYDILLAMLRHLIEDVDAELGYSVGGQGGEYFADKTLEQRLSLMISGFTSPKLTWAGVVPLLRQMESFLDLVESGHAFLLTYEQLTGDKPLALKRLMRFLELDLSEERLGEIADSTAKEAMRERKRDIGMDRHISRPEEKLRHDVFQPYHKEMVDFAIHAHAPRLPERLVARKLGGVLEL